MSYEIGYAPRGDRHVRTTQKATAREALATARALIASDEEIRHIKAPYGGQIGMGELELAAEREGPANA